ncbi:DUF3240 domain-containing protein [Sphingomonas colocasiae]|uniref:DUF3240 domain-containing protein n=1 Tax=Sphingomonas colocasiae TaxID=1848973 RepID=A0ABS7PWR8_9SPHN|nr:DUF3240 domain-containing protein [Sphingomonas colocasiae]MBY8824429.1 DUF3240 domain-containing protein [Sphingomonas colocasiae]
MTRMLLTLFCGVDDADQIATALRDHAGAPVHLHREAVLGRDYADAATAERVAGTLDRMAIEVELDAGQLAGALDAATRTRRRLPFRWRTVRLEQGGRIA